MSRLVSYNFLTDTDSTLNKNIKEVIKRDYHKEDDTEKLVLEEAYIFDVFNDIQEAKGFNFNEDELLDFAGEFRDTDSMCEIDNIFADYLRSKINQDK